MTQAAVTTTIGAMDRTPKSPRDFQPTLARRLTEARRAKGLDQSAFAKAFRPRPLTSQAINQWEVIGGTVPSIANLMQAAEILGVTVDWLLGRGPDEMPRLIKSASQPGLDRDLMARSLLALHAHLATLPNPAALTPEDMTTLALALHDWAADQAAQGAAPNTDQLRAFLAGAMAAARA